jgi:phage I-like protein
MVVLLSYSDECRSLRGIRYHIGRREGEEMLKAGYWVDFNTVRFDEDGLTTWIQAMPLGTYQHPVHGTIEITPERVQRFAQNVNTGVRGQDLDIDYDHKDRSGEAAGWVKKAEARSDGLWLAVEWTKDAAQKIKNKAYRYFSPEFVDEWKHPKDQQTFKDVLFGGGITNRPFLKDILPINMSELRVEPAKKQQGGTSMDRKKLCELLGLPADADDAAVTAAITKLKETPPPPVVKTEPPAGDEQLKKLAEDNPVIKQLLETQAAQAKQLAQAEQALRLSETTTRVAKLSEGKDWAFPAVVLNDLPAALVEMPTTLSDKVVELLGKMAETGLVQLGEEGSTRRKGRENDGDPVKNFNDKVLALTKDGKMQYADAVESVALSDPEAYRMYAQATYVGREN